MADPSRRALVGGLAALLAPATATASVMPEEDPIFTAIERHRCALAALENIDERAEVARYAAAEQEIAAATDAMFTTAPQTAAGAKALVDYIIERADADDDAGWCLKTLEVLRPTLGRLATQAAA